MARAIFLFLASAFLFGPNFPLMSASLQDEVIFKNGQKLIGEIKGLDKGMLSFNTDETGTISVKWVKVAGLSSTRRFRVELGTGQLLIGSLEGGSEEGKVVIATATGKVLLGLDLIVTIDPLEKKLLDRLKGNLSVGFSLQQAQSLTTLTIGARASYQAPKLYLNLSASSYVSQQEAVATTTRNDAALGVQRDLRKRWLALGMAGFQQNEELGLSRRLTLGGGVGNRLIFTNNMILTVAAGAVGVDEKYSDVESSAQNVDAILMGNFEVFRHTFPKLNFVLNGKVFPSLTDWGRVRFELETSFSYEFISDFYVSLDGFYTYDTRPPEETISKRDYGLSTSIRWEFNQ